MNATKRTPQLRFPEFAGEWQEKRLGEIAINKPSTITAGQLSDNFEGYAVYGASGIAGYVKSFQHEQPYTAVIKDGAGAGRLLWHEGETSVLSTLTVLLPRQSIDAGYLHYVLQGIDFSKYMTGSTIPHVYYRDFSKAKLKVPTLEEQQKIAAFLAVVDKRVALLERKVQQLEAYKRGVMQQLFSQQLRFTRPDGSHFPVWEKKQLGEVFLERSDRGIPGEMLSVTIANGLVPFSSIDKKDNSNPDKSKYKSVVKGDIVYNTMRMWQGASGLAVSSGICSPAYTVVIPKRGQLGLFWSYRIKNQDAINLFQRWSQGLTTDTWNLKFPVFSKLEFYCPSEEEQQKIAEFLSALDEKIALTRQQLDKTKQFKKGLLQRMFV